ARCRRPCWAARRRQLPKPRHAPLPVASAEPGQYGRRMPERARPTPAAPPPGAASTMVRFFAVCHPGLEPLVAAELEHLGAAGTLRHGGVEGSCSLSQLWQLHHGSNLAESFRVRLKSFVARDFGALEQG